MNAIDSRVKDNLQEPSPLSIKPTGDPTSHVPINIFNN